MTGGSSFKLVNGRAVPTGIPYMQLRTTPSEPIPEKPWTIWRNTLAAKEDAPSWDDLSDGDRALWLDGMSEAEADAFPLLWPRLAAWVAKSFERGQIKRTPGATGLDLIQRTLPMSKADRAPYRYPQIGAGYGRMFIATSFDHRIEKNPLADILHDDGIATYLYDARIAYAAHLRHLPVLIGDGATLIDDDGPYVPYRNGRYLVRVTVPRGWRRIGLVPASIREWPHTPGEEWECWLDESEVRLLQDYDWTFRVKRRILFASSKEHGEDPLREWSAIMCGSTVKHGSKSVYVPGVLEQLDAAPHTVANRAMRKAMRSLVLHPIGNWHKGKNQPPDAPSFDSIDEANNWLQNAPTERELTEWQRHNRRPEWSVAIYARTRVAATRRALEAVGPLLRIHGDAVECSEPQPWEDNGRIGCYRLKGSSNG